MKIEQLAFFHLEELFALPCGVEKIVVNSTT
jgi:hypothetical protein